MYQQTKNPAAPTAEQNTFGENALYGITAVIIILPIALVAAANTFLGTPLALLGAGLGIYIMKGGRN